MAVVLAWACENAKLAPTEQPCVALSSAPRWLANPDGDL